MATDRTLSKWWMLKMKPFMSSSITNLIKGSKLSIVKRYIFLLFTPAISLEITLIIFRDIARLWCLLQFWNFYCFVVLLFHKLVLYCFASLTKAEAISSFPAHQLFVSSTNQNAEMLSCAFWLVENTKSWRAVKLESCKAWYSLGFRLFWSR